MSVGCALYSFCGLIFCVSITLYCITLYERGRPLHQCLHWFRSDPIYMSVTSFIYIKVIAIVIASDKFDLNLVHSLSLSTQFYLSISMPSTNTIQYNTIQYTTHNTYTQHSYNMKHSSGFPYCSPSNHF